MHSILKIYNDNKLINELTFEGEECCRRLINYLLGSCSFDSVRKYTDFYKNDIKVIKIIARKTFGFDHRIQGKYEETFYNV